jgi:hypothetical protein
MTTRKGKRLLQAWVPKKFADDVDKMATEKGCTTKALIQMSLSTALHQHKVAKAQGALAELKAASAAQYATDGEALF